ncbi:MAG: hypothetical protein Q4G33_10435 [bacterium]|nr:hypothetical protein [bacterium]
MKKQFETPVVNIQMFMTENIITTSGNASKMKEAMEGKGYTVTTKSLGNFFGS